VPRKINAAMQCALAPAPAKLREATLSDFDTVTELKRRGGIVLDPIENWHRLWTRNPALQRMENLPIGWVLEARGRIVGYLGNVALLYHYAGKTLTAVTGTGFVVDPEYRAASLTLDSAFYRQKRIDLHLATTAIESVGKLAMAFRSSPLPQPDFDAVLFWVLQPYPFVKTVVKKLGLAPPLPGIGSALASIAIQSDQFFRRRWPSECSADLEVSELDACQIGDEFDEFWNEKCGEASRLYADRSAATLRWHFAVPGFQGTTRVLSCRRKREFLGYAVVRNDVEQPDGLRRSLVADLIAKRDDTEAIRALFLAAFEIARRAKSHVLEVIGLPETVRRVLGESKPYVRRFPACPFYYRAADSHLHKTLSSAAVWYVSAYDGDRTLMP